MGRLTPGEFRLWTWTGTNRYGGSKDNFIVFLQRIMCGTNVSKEMWAWTEMEARRGVLPQRSTLRSPGHSESQGQKVKEKQTLILFKEELSNNLCSPKMELAVAQQSWVAICQGGAAGPASWARKGWVREPCLILTAQGTRAQGADLSPKKWTTGWKAGLTVSIWGFAFSPSENWREKVTAYSREFVDNFDSLRPSIYSVSGYFLLD